jgi:hypothetical protein
MENAAHLAAEWQRVKGRRAVPGRNGLATLRSPRLIALMSINLLKSHGYLHIANSTGW